MNTKPNILITLENGKTRETHFPQFIQTRLAEIGNVRWNETGKPFTAAVLRGEIADTDICLTHWGCPAFSDDVVNNAKKLKLIAHAAGSVADLCSAGVYDKNIKVTSANDVMAFYVAEGALAYILCSLRRIQKADNLMKSNVMWPREDMVRAETLISKKVSLIGLGAVGRNLLRLLEPFNVRAAVYDPYINEAQFKSEKLPCDAELKSLNDALAWGDVISVHASLTPETINLLGKNELALIRDKCTVINTARGAIIDESALINELERGRLYAVLDVYNPEPPAADSPLRKLENVILVPHMAGVTARENMTSAILDEIERFLQGKSLLYEIRRERFEKMTRHSLVNHS